MYVKCINTVKVVQNVSTVGSVSLISWRRRGHKLLTVLSFYVESDF